MVRPRSVAGDRWLEITANRNSRVDMMVWLAIDLTQGMAKHGSSANWLRDRLKAWSTLFRGGDSRSVLGLVGELIVLRWLAMTTPQGADVWHCWGGQERTRHDIVTPEQAFEVKTTTVRTGWRVHVNGLKQAIRAEGEPPLQFVLVRLEPAVEGGFRLCDLVADIPDSCLPGGSAFKDELREQGVFDTFRWNLLEARSHIVSPESPFLLSADFAADAQRKLDLIGDLSYSIELGGEVLTVLDLSIALPGTKS